MATSIPDKIRNGLAKAKLKLDSIMVDIQQLPTTGRDQHGPTHGDPVDWRAIVEYVGESVIGDDGQEHLTTAKLTILEPIDVKTADLFILKGEEQNIAKVESLLDPDGVPYYAVVWLGRGKFVQN